MAKNPSRPNDSPIKVTHHGADPTEWRHEASREKKDPVVQPIPNARCWGSIKEYQESKSESAQIDKRLEAAINKDLQTRNIRTK